MPCSGTWTYQPNTNSPVPFPDLTLYVKQSSPPTNPPPDYDAIGTNHLSLPPPGTWTRWTPIGTTASQNSTTQNVNFDFSMDITVTNELGDYLSVLEGMNDALGPYYRYETGTSMAAADVSGMLALMQEFFQRQARTNSPALMKAMLINGARSLGGAYDFFTQPPINFQGWGLINLPTTLPASLTNSTGTTNSMVLVDQNPATALATGQSQTFHLTLSPTATTQPLRITLVWTDPPGNPVASVKLVNDLDLIVTNLDSTNLVYFGNDIQTGNDFNQPWQTNDVPDSVNNVENVYLEPRGRGEWPAGDQLLHHGLWAPGQRQRGHGPDQQRVPGLCAGRLDRRRLAPGRHAHAGHERAGDLGDAAAGHAGHQQLRGDLAGLLGRHPAQPAGGGEHAVAGHQHAPGHRATRTRVFTMGMTNQWHFYVITNDTGFTNAAFLTFLPPTLSIPRMGVFARQRG